MTDSSLQLSIAPTPHTAAVVAALRGARAAVPCAGSICAALDRPDAGADLPAAAYEEALAALRVGALVFGIASPALIGAHEADAAGVVDVAIYHLTGAPGDVGPALEAFRRAAGPPLAATV